MIGLTGGIGSGKSTVAEYLAKTYHLPIRDADIYAREAVAFGSPILGAIAHRFGPQILLPDGSLDRQQLGEIVFQSDLERQWLEQQIHPYVGDRLMADLQSTTDPLVVLVVPLLFEAGMTDRVTDIWAVWCTPEQQLTRLMSRNGLTQEQALARIRSQWPLEEKCRRARVVLDNSMSLEYLYDQIDRAIALNR